ncbi:hypothetical protein PF011_g5639 [Phytophthora fragariae]|uniref:Uncharacterized protein n=1 Tax=Phytophthora fragariae TaxID=53985 RepID=A0A6A3LP12_9STRA|nr:hypothetical protein PF011_g5639 [Phytophthora fragariae]
MGTAIMASLRLLTGLTDCITGGGASSLWKCWSVLWLSEVQVLSSVLSNCLLVNES